MCHINPMTGNRPGRPALPDEKRKNHYLRLRCNGEHRDLLMQCAQYAGISFSAWAMRHLMIAARAEAREAGSTEEERR